MRALDRLLLAKELGHGRALEIYLALVSAIYGFILLFPGTALHSKATVDLVHVYGPEWLALAPLLHAVTAGTGLWANVTGRPLSRQLRFVGSLLGLLLWSWLAFKLGLQRDFGTVGFPFTTVAALFSLRVMRLSYLNLPAPGAPGQLGR